jgi:hypothetical protein
MITEEDSERTEPRFEPDFAMTDDPGPVMSVSAGAATLLALPLARKALLLPFSIVRRKQISDDISVAMPFHSKISSHN